MHNNFQPIHLKQANRGLDKHRLAPKPEYTYPEIQEDKSLWKKILGVFKK